MSDAAPRVALATASGSWDLDVDAPLMIDALAQVGVEAVPAVWDDPAVDWATFDLVTVRSTWDYMGRLADFTAWARRVERVTTLANPAAVIEWNTDKHYLAELERHGVGIVPTVFLEAGELDAERAPEAARDALGTQLDASSLGEAVVKPTVSAGSKDTLRVGHDDIDRGVDLAVALLRTGRSAMVQPYLDAVDEHGETGLVSLAGEFSHAFTKGAILQRGAGLVEGPYAEERISPAVPTSDELDLRTAALEAIGARFGPLLYSRIDVIAGADGRPVVLEAELTEPSLFLSVDEDAPARFALAVVQWAEQSVGRSAR